MLDEIRESFPRPSLVTQSIVKAVRASARALMEDVLQALAIRVGAVLAELVDDGVDTA